MSRRSSEGEACSQVSSTTGVFLTVTAKVEGRNPPSFGSKQPRITKMLDGLIGTISDGPEYQAASSLQRSPRCMSATTRRRNLELSAQLNSVLSEPSDGVSGTESQKEPDTFLTEAKGKGLPTGTGSKIGWAVRPPATPKEGTTVRSAREHLRAARHAVENLEGKTGEFVQAWRGGSGGSPSYIAAPAVGDNRGDRGEEDRWLHHNDPSKKSTLSVRATTAAGRVKQKLEAFRSDEGLHRELEERVNYYQRLRKGKTECATWEEEKQEIAQRAHQQAAQSVDDRVWPSSLPEQKQVAKWLEKRVEAKHPPVERRPTADEIKAHNEQRATLHKKSAREAAVSAKEARVLASTAARVAHLNQVREEAEHRRQLRQAAMDWSELIALAARTAGFAKLMAMIHLVRNCRQTIDLRQRYFDHWRAPALAAVIQQRRTAARSNWRIAIFSVRWVVHLPLRRAASVKIKHLLQGAVRMGVMSVTLKKFATSLIKCQRILRRYLEFRSHRIQLIHFMWIKVENRLMLERRLATNAEGPKRTPSKASKASNNKRLVQITEKPHGGGGSSTFGDRVRELLEHDFHHLDRNVPFHLRAKAIDDYWIVARKAHVRSILPRDVSFLSSLTSRRLNGDLESDEGIVRVESRGSLHDPGSSAAGQPSPLKSSRPMSGSLRSRSWSIHSPTKTARPKRFPLFPPPEQMELMVRNTMCSFRKELMTLCGQAAVTVIHKETADANNGGRGAAALYSEERDALFEEKFFAAEQKAQTELKRKLLLRNGVFMLK